MPLAASNSRGPQAELPLSVEGSAGEAVRGLGGARYVAVPSRSVLNWVQGRHLADVYSLNPYRGCEFGCAYCYARYTHEYLGLTGWLDFERTILVKRDADAALRRDLRRCDVAKHGIAVGTATDPYQPAERTFRVTRRLLEALLPLSGISVSIVTKGATVEDDAELLGVLAKRHDLSVSFSCMGMDPTFARGLEPRAPSPARRLRAMANLAEHGVRCGVLVAPVLPAITDGEETLRSVLAASRDAGASFYSYTVLHLSGCSRDHFFSWLGVRAPDFGALYRTDYALRAGTETYRAMFSQRIQMVAAAVGLPQAPSRSGRRGANLRSSLAEKPPNGTRLESRRDRSEVAPQLSDTQNILW